MDSQGQGRNGTIYALMLLGTRYVSIHLGSEVRALYRSLFPPRYFYFHPKTEYSPKVPERSAGDFLLGISSSVLTSMRATHIVHRVLVT